MSDMNEEKIEGKEDLSGKSPELQRLFAFLEENGQLPENIRKMIKLGLPAEEFETDEDMLNAMAEKHEAMLASMAEEHEAVVNAMVEEYIKQQEMYEEMAEEYVKQQETYEAMAEEYQAAMEPDEEEYEPEEESDYGPYDDYDCGGYDCDDGYSGFDYDARRDTFDALTDGMYGDYDGCDWGDLMDALGYD